MPVAIARREIHAGIGAGRVFAKNLLDQADALEEQRPVDRRQQPHRGDDVADRDLVRGLALVLAAEHGLGRVVLGLEGRLQRLPGRGGGRRLVAQPLQELDHERRRQPPRPSRRRGQRLVDHRRGLLGRVDEPQSPAARVLALPARRHDVRREPAELVHEGDTEHDRDGPDLPDRQRRDALIGADVADERLQVEAPRGVRDELPGDQEHPRVAEIGAGRQLGQLDVVLPRQVLADGPDLVLDDVMVVAQPVFRRHGLAAPPGRGQVAIGRIELPGAVVEVGNERPAARGVRQQRAVRRQPGRVRFELLLAEEVGRGCRRLERVVERSCGRQGTSRRAAGVLRMPHDYRKKAAC